MTKSTVKNKPNRKFKPHNKPKVQRKVNNKTKVQIKSKNKTKAQIKSNNKTKVQTKSDNKTKVQTKTNKTRVEKNSNSKSNKKKEKVQNKNAKSVSMFQHVLNAAEKLKHSEFSLRRNNVLISDTLIKNAEKNNFANKFEFKSCSIHLDRVNKVDKTPPKKIVQIKTSPKQKAILKKSCVGRRTMRVENRISIKKIKSAKLIGTFDGTKVSTIPAAIENEINNYAKESITLGWSIMKKYLPYFIQHCINKRELDLFSNGLKLLANNLPSSNFIKNYMRKYNSIYKDILEEKPFKSLASTDEKNLFYFNLCWHLINQYGIRTESFLNQENKNRIFCCGDYSFTCDYKNIIEINEGLASNNKKKGENVFFCVSATGKVFDPLVLNKGLTVKTYESSNYADNKYWQQATEDGLMCAESFHLWLITSFRPHLVNANIKKPVILFFNSDSPYISIPVLDFCKENEIILFAIPTQFSELVNPLNMSCFNPLSLEYCRIFKIRAEETAGHSKEFSPLILIAALNRINFNGCAVSAFDKSGLLKKESYSLKLSRTNAEINVEERLPSRMKNSSYNLGKQIGMLLCYQKIMSSSVVELNTTSTESEKRLFNEIKQLYMEQSQKCTELIDVYNDPGQKVGFENPVKTSNYLVQNVQFEKPVQTSNLNTMALNAESILRIQSPSQIKQDYNKFMNDLYLK